MGSKLRRLSVAVDDNISRILERLSEEENKTISDIIRTAIITYAEVAGEPGHIDEIKKYEQFLMGRDHVIVDLEIWIALLDFANTHGDEELWKTIEDVGYESGIEFKLRGLKLRDVFKHLEYKNILQVKYEDGVTVLVLSSRNEAKLLLHYLKGVFKAMDIKVRLIPGVRKIVVTEEDAEV